VAASGSGGDRDLTVAADGSTTTTATTDPEETAAGSGFVVRPHGEACGEYSLTQGQQPDPDTLAMIDCLKQAYDNHRAAFLRRHYPTIEGDPIAELIQVEEDRRVLVEHDATQDRFGSGKVEVYECKKLSVRDGTLLYDDCGEPAGPAVLCPPEAVKLEVGTDKPRYNPGEQVSVTWTATNNSGGDCIPFHRSGAVITDAAGTVHHRYAATAKLAGGFRWYDGRALGSATSWLQQVDGDPARPAAPGRYTATVTLEAQDPDLQGRTQTYIESVTFEIAEK
jgi:hypothetical protein